VGTSRQQINNSPAPVIHRAFIPDILFAGWSSDNTDHHLQNYSATQLVPTGAIGTQKFPVPQQPRVVQMNPGPQFAAVLLQVVKELQVGTAQTFVPSVVGTQAQLPEQERELQVSGNWQDTARPQLSRVPLIAAVAPCFPQTSMAWARTSRQRKQTSGTTTLNSAE
jgi:hypothetical protein